MYSQYHSNGISLKYSKVSRHIPRGENVIQIQKGIQKSRKCLTEEDVLNIFKVKLFNDVCSCSDRIDVGLLSERYGVSKKSIRNIWKRKTWAAETSGFPIFKTESLKSSDITQDTCRFEPSDVAFEAQDFKDPFHGDWPYWKETEGNAEISPLKPAIADLIVRVSC